FAVEVNVEGADVEERKVEEFGWREIDVGQQAVWRNIFRGIIEIPEKPADARVPVPADDAGRNLVAKREHEHGRVIRQFGDTSDDLAFNVVPKPAVIEKCNMLRPGQPDHDPQSVASSRIQQVPVRLRIDANRVDAEFRYKTEVFRDLVEAGKLVTRTV